MTQKLNPKSDTKKRKKFPLFLLGPDLKIHKIPEHEHKWFPTNETVKLDINKNPTTNPKEAEYTERKWVCECGAVKWIREIEEDE